MLESPPNLTIQNRLLVLRHALGDEAIAALSETAPTPCDGG